MHCLFINRTKLNFKSFTQAQPTNSKHVCVEISLGVKLFSLMFIRAKLMLINVCKNDCLSL
ncbi:hypothetical protein T01_4779 [Trichinella spiralis]|uniref:Uncharacterized protein n=1 Tax=Trichinella spiralis TaxID=6334 RepID=A0A0V1BR52_TRISP|nr:hypothetical protein T01_4779 [Trichinella spiralis]